MALKGTATIELTDIKTGDKEVIKHDNLVTNAINDLLTMSPMGMKLRSYRNTANNTNDTSLSDMTHELGKSFEAGFLPICPNAIGGILLYENALEEDPAKYYAPMDNPLVGYSSNDVNTTIEKKRGSMNQTESGALEDGSGYRFVFDFSTDQGNGTIAAVGLTSARGGEAGYGSEQDKVGYPMVVVDAGCVSTDKNRALYKNDEEYTRHSFVAVDFENNIAYYARVLSANTIAVGKVKIHSSTLGLVENSMGTSLLEETVITTSRFATVTNTNYYTGYNNIITSYYMDYIFGGTFVDGGDGYIWGFQHKDNAAGNSEGNASVLWIKISLDDFSFEEGELTLDAQLYPFGVSSYNDTGRYNMSYKWTQNCSIIKDNRLYALKYDRKGVYSINLSNPTDIKLMECDFEIIAGHFNPCPESYYYSFFMTGVIELGGIITYANAYINAGKIHKAGYGTVRVARFYDGASSYNYAVSKNKGLMGNLITKPHFGPFFITLTRHCYYYGDSTNTWYFAPHIYLMTPYLATINNLPTPVQKTADKTMKITYILREE